MGCLTVIIQRIGGMAASAVRVGGMTAAEERVGGMAVAAVRRGGVNVAVRRIGGLAVSVGLVCGDTKIPAGAIWAADGLLITADGGYLIGQME